MNKRELAKAVAVQSDTDLRTVSGVIESLQDVVKAAVAKGDVVSISGFAKFTRVDRPARPAREGINPFTREPMTFKATKASKKARITPVKAFKDAVMTPSRAPKLKRGVWPTSDEAVKAAGKSSSAPAPRKAAAKRAAPAKKATKKTAKKATKKTAKKATKKTARGRTTKRAVRRR